MSNPVSYDSFLNCLYETETNPKDQAFFKAIQSNQDLQKLFDEALNNESWVAGHQGLVLNAINAIYPDQEGFKKIEILSSKIENYSLKTLVMTLIYSFLLNPIDEIIDSIDQGEFLHLNSLLQKIEKLNASEVKKIEEEFLYNTSKAKLFFLTLKNINPEIRNYFLTQKNMIHFIKISLSHSKDHEEANLVVQMMLSVCEDVEHLKEILKPDLEGYTPLHLAALDNNLEMSQELLKSVEDDNLKELVFKPNNRGYSPLHLAAMRNNFEMVQELLRAIANDTNLKKLAFERDNEDGNTSLHVAVLGNNLEMIRELLKSVGDDTGLKEMLFQPNNRGYSPLHLAALENNLEAMQELLKCVGNETGIKKLAFKLDNSDYSPVHFAAMHNNFEMVQLLLSTVGDDTSLKELAFKSYKDNDGNTPLHLAVKNHNLLMVREILHSIGDDPDLKELVFKANIFDDTPLHWAALSNNLEIVQELLHALGGNSLLRDLAFKPNLHGITPLHLALKGKNIDLVRCLIDIYNFDISEFIINNPDFEEFIPYFPELKNLLIEKLGGFENISLELGISLLPLFLPNQVHWLVNQVENNEKYLHINQNYLPDFLLLLIEVHGLRSIKPDDLQSVAETIKEDLKDIGFINFSILAKERPDIIILLIPFLTTTQLSCIIPVLSNASLEKLLNSKSASEQSMFIYDMTTEQKQQRLEKDIFFTKEMVWDKTPWEAVIVRANETGNFDPDTLLKFSASTLPIKNILQDLKELKKAYLNNEIDPIRQTIEDKLKKIENKLEALLKESESIKAKMIDMDNKIVPEIPVKYLDALTDLIMKRPLKLPELRDMWIDEDSLEQLKTSTGQYLNPYNRQKYDREDFILDDELRIEIENFNRIQTEE